MARGEAILRDGDEDVTNRYDLTGLDDIEQTTATTGSDADMVLNQPNILALYQGLVLLKEVGYGSLRVLAI